MHIEIRHGRKRLQTTLRALFAALRAVADSDAEAEAVFTAMVEEGRVRVLPDPLAVAA